MICHSRRRDRSCIVRVLQKYPIHYLAMAGDVDALVRAPDAPMACRAPAPRPSCAQQGLTCQGCHCVHAHALKPEMRGRCSGDDGCHVAAASWIGQTATRGLSPARPASRCPVPPSFAPPFCLWHIDCHRLAVVPFPPPCPRPQTPAQDARTLCGLLRPFRLFEGNAGEGVEPQREQPERMLYPALRGR